jgi:hypothetical protein
MPKIPTFDTRIRRTEVTGAAPSLQTDIRATGAESTVLRVQDDLRREVEYYSRKRAAEQDLQSRKIALDIAGDADKIVEGLKTNPEEELSVNTYNEKIKPIVEQRLSNIKSRNIKKLVNKRLEILNITNIATIKKNSHKEFLRQDLTTYNNDQNILLAKYKTADDAMKVLYIRELNQNAENYNRKHILGKTNLENEKKRINALLLFSDAGTFSLRKNGEEIINRRDKELGTKQTLPDGVFGLGVFNAFRNNIEAITVVGDDNADFDQAKVLLNRLKNFKRGNSKIIVGDLATKFATLEQKILTEEARHNNTQDRKGENKIFLTFSTGIKRDLQQNITFKGSGVPPTPADRRAATELGTEYDELLKNFLDNNPTATLEEKKSFVRNMSFSLRNIYLDKNLQALKAREFDTDTFDIIAEKNRVFRDFKLLSENKLDPEVKARYQRIARINGYITTVKTEGKKDQRVGDLNAFFNDYIPILEKQSKRLEAQK